MTDSEGAAPAGDDDPRTLRHSDRTKPFSLPSGTSHLDEITAHVERHFGAVESVFHEVISDLVHIDVLMVQPTADRPYFTLVTCGMSDLPMTVPEGEFASPHAELFVHFASSVPLSQAAFADEKVYWPIRRLKMLARMPHELDTFLAPGHTIATDPPEPVADGVPFCALAVLAPLEEGAKTLACDDGTRIDILQMVPLYREELEWKLAQPAGALADLFDGPALRVVVEGRPNLKGSEADARAREAVIRHEENLRRGRTWLIGVAVVLALVLASQVAVAVARGVDIRWLRTTFEVLILFVMARGDRWARWLIVLHCAVGAVMGSLLLAKRGLATPIEWTLAFAIPFYVASLLVLVFHRGVREYFAHCTRVRRLLAAAAKQRTAEKVSR